MPPPAQDEKPRWWSNSSPYSFPTDVAELMHDTPEARNQSLGMWTV